MKITATPIPNAAAIVLGDTAAGDLVIDPPMLPVEKRAIQKEQIAFAEAAWATGRGNRERSFSWVVERQHADVQAAIAFLHTHAAAVPINCSLKIEDGTGTWNYSSAVITEVSFVAFKGVSTTCRYSVEGAVYQAA